MAPPTEVDVIILGGGAAGCVVAGRLAKADPSLSIAIIEAGIDNKDLATSFMPAMFISHLAPTSTTANFYVAKESEHVAGRGVIVPVGGLLGGGSSINFLMATRASASDYDDWKTEGWAFDDLKPLICKTETHTIKVGQDPSVHGYSGPLQISYGGHQSAMGKEFVAAAIERGVPFTHDAQDFKTGHGVTNWPKWISPTTGRRQDAANGFVHPVLDTQTNLHLLTEQKTIRVLFDESSPPRAIGVEYCHNPLATAPYNPEQPPTVGEVMTMKARKMVVVSSGAFGTPAILERSGVGAKDVLKEAGVEQVVDLPAVGAEYQDHQLTIATYKAAADADTLDDYLRGVPEVHGAVGPQWAKDGSGIVATNAIDGGMKVRPNATELAAMGPEARKVWADVFENAPDKPMMFGGVISALLGDHSLMPGGKYLQAGAFLTYPLSKGSVHINSSSPFAAPTFDAGYLSDPADMDPQVWMYKMLRELIRRMPTGRGPFAALHPKFAADSPAACPEIDVADFVAYKEGDVVVDLVYSAADDEAIKQWLRENVGTTWHSCSTCPMKPEADGGVVDPRLNVYGTAGLKIADLSIMPSNVGSNTYSTALLVGEKAAMIIGEDLGIVGV